MHGLILGSSSCQIVMATLGWQALTAPKEKTKVSQYGTGGNVDIQD